MGGGLDDAKAPLRTHPGVNAAGCAQPRVAMLASTPGSALMPDTARSRHPGYSAGAPAHGARTGWRAQLIAGGARRPR
jgi:hypothetical protein